jgi:hypothetical protein
VPRGALGFSPHLCSIDCLPTDPLDLAEMSFERVEPAGLATGCALCPMLGKIGAGRATHRNCQTLSEPSHSVTSCDVVYRPSVQSGSP